MSQDPFPDALRSTRRRSTFRLQDDLIMSGICPICRGTLVVRCDARGPYFWCLCRHHSNRLLPSIEKRPDDTCPATSNDLGMYQEPQSHPDVDIA